jgi:hypothetical protein
VSTLTEASPGSLRRIRRGWTSADAIASIAIAVGVLGTLAVGTQVYLRGDDWVLLATVAEQGFAAGDLLTPYGSHLMPLGLLVFWVSRAVGGPTPWWWLVGFGTVIASAALTFTWLCIRALVGPRARAVVPFLIAAWAPGVMTAVLWPSPSVYMTPLFLATAAGLWGYLRFRLTGRRSGQVVALLGLGLGLLACELALFIPIVLFVVGVSWFGTGTVAEGITSTWSRSRWMWLGMTAMTVLYAGVYLALALEAQTLPEQRAGLDLLVEALMIMGLQTLPTMIVGGPWMWNDAMGPIGALPGPVYLVVAVVAWSVLALGRRARWRAWWPLLTILLLTVLALSAARIATFGPSVVRNPYYGLGALSLLSITLAVCYLPSALPIDRPERRGPGRFALVAATGVLAVSVLVAFSTYSAAVPRAPSRDYIAAARTSLSEPSLNVSSPREAFGVFLHEAPWDTSAHTFDLVGVPGSWVESGQTPEMLDEDGLRAPAGIEDEAAFDLPDICIPIAQGVRMTMPPFREPNWPTFRLAYTAGSDVEGFVDIGGARTPLLFRTGDNTVTFVGDGRPDDLVLWAPDVCVRALGMGPPAPTAE